MTARTTRILHIDGIAHPVPAPVWAHFRFLTAQLASMANHATKQAERVRALEAPASLADTIAANFRVSPKRAQIIAALFRANGAFVQTRTLADACATTENAIPVHAHHLRKAGLGVKGVKRLGYRLTPAAMEKCREVCGVAAEADEVAEVAAA